jgi:type III secretion system FlhB-like substrate exporter
MTDKHEDERFEEQLVRCRDRVLTAWACAALLRPDLSAAGKEKLAKKILKMAESEDHRLGITPAQAQEIVLSNIQCIAKNCPLLIFADPLARELNAFFHEDH